MLRILSREELSVGELAHVLDVPQSGVSRHLAMLRGAGLVKQRRQGSASHYSVFKGESLYANFLRGALDEVEVPAEVAERLGRALELRAERSRGFFEGLGASWDELRCRLVDDSLPWRALSLALPQHLVIGDFGTGTGSLLPALASVAERVYGLDRSEAMLSAARRRCGSLGIRNVLFVRGELEALPLAPESVDIALSALVLHHVTRPGEAIRQMARAARPGGQVVVADLVRHGHEWLRSEQADLWLGFERDEVCGFMSDAGLEGLRFHLCPSAIPPRSSGGPLKLFIASATKPAEGK